MPPSSPLALLPHLCTLGSVFCGLYSILIAAQLGEAGGDTNGLVLRAAAAILLGLLLDGADGRIARWTGTESRFGLEFDSLADLVTFGVAPAVLVHRVGLGDLGLLGMVVCFTFVGTGAFRLARYNIEASERARSGRETKETPRVYSGLPIPVAGTLLVVAVLLTHGIEFAAGTNAYVLVAVTIVASALMVSPLRFRARF